MNFLVIEGVFLMFEGEIPQGKKTYLIKVSAKDGFLLGIIKWKPQWRRYCFFPEPKTLFDSACLKEVFDLIDHLMKERKKTMI